MKKIALVCALLALSLPMYARNLSRLARMTATNPASLTINPADPDLPARLIGQLKARRAAAHSGVHTSAITDSVSARALVIPAAGSLAGGGGTLFFRSDVTLVNYRATPQQVLAGIWPAGTTNNFDPVNYKTITLQPNAFVTVQDFVVNALGKSNVLGTIIVIPYTGVDIDPFGAIDGFSRIYTKQPGSNGTVSQPFDAVDPDTFSSPLIDEAIALGLRQDADFRTNFGIVNVDEKDRIFKVTFIGEKLTTTLTLTVKAFGMIQQGVPAGDYGALQIVYQVTNAGSDFVTWVGYASSTDNITGDGWVSLASADLTPAELDLIGY
jgi:hypothetical protein